MNKWNHTSVKQQIKTKDTEQKSSIRLCLSITLEILRKLPFVFTPFIIEHNVSIAKILASLKPDKFLDLKFLILNLKITINIKTNIQELC